MQGQDASGPRDQDFMDYIADMVLELRDLARSAEAETLTDLLDLAHREARQHLKRHAAG